MDALTTMSSITGGLENFGTAMQYRGLAKSLDLNAGLLDIESGGVIKAGEFQSRRMREQGDKFISRQRAMYSKAGVKFSGSAAQMWAETERNIRLDITMTQLNAANKANQIGFQALNQRIAAGQARTRAYAEMSKGLLKMASGFAMQGGGNMGGGGVSGYGNVYGSNTPSGVVDMGTYSRLPR